MQVTMKRSILLILLVVWDAASSKVTVVSKPPAVYFLRDGSQQVVTLKCSGIDEDGVFQYFITNALWFQNFTNGSSNPIGGSGPVSAFRYSLIFQYGVREVDQGNYSCCAPGGGCSELSLVAFAVPPVIEVENTNYTAFVGSSVTLACRIVYEGSPRASFRWRRHGFYVHDDFVLTNNTHTMLQLTNLTEEDHGYYRCVVNWVLKFTTHEVYLNTQVFPKIRIGGPSLALTGSNISITCSVLEGRPSPNVHIITPSGEAITANIICFTAASNNSGNYTCVGSTALATVTATYHLSLNDNMENETSKSNTAKIHENTFSYDFLVTLNNTEECSSIKNKGFAVQLTTSLKEYIIELHDNKTQVSVIPTLFKCISNSTALYDVEIRGNMINNTYKHLEGVKTIELGNATLTICIQSCDIFTTNVVDNQPEVDDDESTNASVIVGSSVSGSLAVIVLICVAVIAGLICIRHKNKFRQQHVVRCTGPSIPSVTNTITAMSEGSNKPVQVDVNVKIAVVKTDEATSPCTRDNNDTSHVYDDVLVVQSVDIANM